MLATSLSGKVHSIAGARVKSLHRVVVTSGAEARNIVDLGRRACIAMGGERSWIPSRMNLVVSLYVTMPRSEADDVIKGEGDEEDNLPRKTIEVTVVEGRDLTKMDFAFKGGGKSDPYVLVKFGKETNKSEVIKKNLNPTWNYNCVVGKEKRVTKTFLGNGGGQMTFEVYDWDQVGADDKVNLRLRSERCRF